MRTTLRGAPSRRARPGSIGSPRRSVATSSVPTAASIARRWPTSRLRELEAIIHPEVARLLVESVEPYRDTDDVIVYAVPLLAERGMAEGFDVVVVVVADVDRRIERL